MSAERMRKWVEKNREKYNAHRRIYEADYRSKNREKLRIRYRECDRRRRAEIPTVPQTTLDEIAREAEALKEYLKGGKQTS